MNHREMWQRYQQFVCDVPAVGIRLDVSRVDFDSSRLQELQDPIKRALDAMEALERGAVANVDEDRCVGHYWLRNPAIAPDTTIQDDISNTINAVKTFVDRIHSGEIAPQRGDAFDIVLLIGIGGSALGPQFLCDALGGVDDPMIIRYLDNTDPDGIDRVLDELDEALAQTLTIVVSKSGGTVETQNAMLETADRYRQAGLDFARHAVAITGDDSALHREATANRWLATFPIWDWVGGRTSVTSAVGLLPAALTGVDVAALLAGARACDEATRVRDTARNPAALLAACWWDLTRRGRRHMALIPYKDRLGLLTRYMQQLVMESLGKRVDRAGNEVHEGLTVFGHKGSTDQHSYIQQLRDGPNDFFATFVHVLSDRGRRSMLVADDVTAGDHLTGFLLGTRDALYEADRESITITLDRVDAESLGALIALFERTVGLYAELANINAYDQPGVEAGKKAAQEFVDLQRNVLRYLRDRQGSGTDVTVTDVADALGVPDEAERIFHILEHAAANPDHGVTRKVGAAPTQNRYSASEGLPV